EYDIPPLYCLIKADETASRYIMTYFQESRVVLGYESLSYEEMRKMLSGGDRDEAHFLVCKGALPIGWLKLNGLSGEKAWISMLIIGEKFRRQGAGEFAVKYAEAFVKAAGYNSLSLHTGESNIYAQRFYEKYGFAKISENKENKTLEYSKTFSIPEADNIIPIDKNN
ncbi:GNAT family N-acetyltransferase, partial [Eubacteriales bacterium OttesenSCG-928-G02]|nr:GNAT family N-acetyltransferase [Eubacteriales bacterium OttesenSCG-928-G02]